MDIYFRMEHLGFYLENYDFKYTKRYSKKRCKRLMDAAGSHPVLGAEVKVLRERFGDADNAAWLRLIRKHREETDEVEQRLFGLK